MKWKVPKKSGMFLLVTSPSGGSGGVYSVRQGLTELQSDDVCFSDSCCRFNDPTLVAMLALLLEITC